jgi:peptide/nickel transport system ATP-binding protein
VTLLDVRDLRVSFPSEAGRVQAVRGVDLTVERGEVLAVVGESGSGKSVSAMSVMGLLPSSAKVAGSVKLDGQELLGLSDRDMSDKRGKRMAMIFQDPLSALTPVFTVGKQIAEAVAIHGDVSDDKAMTRAVELLDMVGIARPVERAKSFPHEFSGGMRQRVVIAMAIANDPDLIIADEPTTALDVTVQAQVLDLLRTAQEVTGAGVILVTHDLGVVAGSADRVVVMYAGRAVETGPVDRLFAQPTMPYTVGLLGSLPRLDDRDRRRLVPIEGQPPSLVGLAPGCPFAERCPLADDHCRSVEPVLQDVLPEQRSACHHSADVVARQGDAHAVYGEEEVAAEHEAEIDKPPVLRVRGLTKRFPVGRLRKARWLTAVDQVSFDVLPGETLALVGESGCGKTTTLLSVLSLDSPEAGTVEVLGHDTATIAKRDRQALRSRLGLVMQDPMASLDPRLPVFDLISEPMRTKGATTVEMKERVVELLQLVGLRAEHASRYPSAFSGGQRQRICIARALALQPDLVILDEPVSALDVSVRAGIVNLLEDLQAELGLTYLMVAHDLSLVRHISDRIAVMYLGRIVELGRVDDVYERPQHPYTRALLSAIPVPDPKLERARKRIVLTGDVPSPLDQVDGCRFRGRCPTYASLSSDDERTRCSTVEPVIDVAAGVMVACHFPQRPT